MPSRKVKAPRRGRAGTGGEGKGKERRRVTESGRSSIKKTSRQKFSVRGETWERSKKDAGDAHKGC